MKSFIHSVYPSILLFIRPSIGALICQFKYLLIEISFSFSFICVFVGNVTARIIANSQAVLLLVYALFVYLFLCLLSVLFFISLFRFLHHHHHHHLCSYLLFLAVFFFFFLFFCSCRNCGWLNWGYVSARTR